MVIGYGLFVSSGDHLGLTAVLSIGALIGVGMGIISVTSMVAAQNGVPLNQLGVATSTVMLSRMFGGAFGITLMGSVLFSYMQRQLVRLSTGSAIVMSHGLIQSLADPQNLLDPSTRASIPDSLLAPLVEILSRSIWYAFLTGFFVMLAGLGLSFFISASTPTGTVQAKRGGSFPPAVED